MATNISNLDIGLLVGSFGGVGVFFRGFRIYREYLRVQGTPGIPIRSIAMGLVHIHGKAVSEQPVSSPVSHTPCCFYQVHIEKWKDEGDSGTWLHYGSEVDGVRFYLEDSSGRVLVDARGAEYDLESTCVREVSSARPSIVVPRGASDAELLGYVTRVGPSAEVPGTRHFLEGERAMLATSKYIKHPTTPDELFQGMVGPQVAQMRQRFEDEGPQSDPLREELRLAQIDLYKHPFWSPEYAEGRKRVVKLQAQVKKAGPRIETPPPLAPPAPPQQTPTAEDIVASVDGTLSAGGRYQFTECCILPDHEYDITGTCGENPEAKDVNDRNLIRKAPKEPTYLISGLAQPDVNVMLQMRAQLMIVGGGMLAVFCLGLLLLRFGLF
jgi:hypothetical protein